MFDGKLLTREEAEKKVRQAIGEEPQDKYFDAVTKKAIIVRMLHNLLNVAESEKDGASMLRYLDGILAVDANAHDERWAREVFRYRAGLCAGRWRIATSCSSSPRRTWTWNACENCEAWWKRIARFWR